jgi:hypothetical protein
VSRNKLSWLQLYLNWFLNMTFPDCSAIYVFHFPLCFPLSFHSMTFMCIRIILLILRPPLPLLLLLLICLSISQFYVFSSTKIYFLMNELHPFCACSASSIVIG